MTRKPRSTSNVSFTKPRVCPQKFPTFWTFVYSLYNVWRYEATRLATYQCVLPFKLWVQVWFSVFNKFAKDLYLFFLNWFALRLFHLVEKIKAVFPNWKEHWVWRRNIDESTLKPATMSFTNFSVLCRTLGLVSVPRIPISTCTWVSVSSKDYAKKHFEYWRKNSQVLMNFKSLP